VLSSAHIVIPGRFESHYNFATGEVLVSTNGVGLIEIIGYTNLLIPGNAVPLGSVPNAQFQDPPTTGAINYATFNPAGLGTGSPGILNDFSLGTILPAGLPLSQLMGPNATVWRHWAVAGGGEFLEPFYPWPEPSSFTLASLAGFGLISYTRQRRAAV
jgi:hypothetical protein